jgi:hypothetical protein
VTDPILPVSFHQRGFIGCLCSDLYWSASEKIAAVGPGRSNRPADFQPFQQGVFDLANLGFRCPSGQSHQPGKSSWNHETHQRHERTRHCQACWFTTGKVRPGKMTFLDRGCGKGFASRGEPASAFRRGKFQPQI